MKNFTITTKELPDSEVEITVEVAWKEFESFRPKGLKKIQKEAVLPGFRKGSVPEAMIVSKIGEQAILGEAAEILIQESYSDIVKESKIAPIASPSVSITKLAAGNPLSFTLKIPVLPKIDLADYKKIVKKTNAEAKESEKSGEVTEKEIDEAFDRVKKGYDEHMKQHADAGEKESDHGHDHTPPSKEDVKNHLIAEKKNRAIEKKRLSAIEGIIAESKITLPKILVESELDKMFQQFESDITRMGIPVKDYFNHLKKTPEEIKNEMRPDAEKRVKTDIILAEIANKEKITADKTRVEEELKVITSMYPDAEPVRARVYVEHMLTNQAVFDFLDGQ